MSNELVIVGDVIKSRKKFDPSDWKGFHQTIHQLNDIFSSKLKIPFSVYSGDSFGGVCDTLESAISILLFLQEKLIRFNSRLILIEGDISFGMQGKDFGSLEGKALWESQETFRELKKGSGLFMANLRDHKTTLLLNTILNLIFMIRDDWKNLDWEVYSFFRSNKSQKEIAQNLGYSQQYISKILRTAKMKQVWEAENNLKELINGYFA